MRRVMPRNVILPRVLSAIVRYLIEVRVSEREPIPRDSEFPCR
jgi:hypothetical protein